MITFKQFIAEDSTLDLRALCAKFILESRGVPLYRGTNRVINVPTIITPRTNRTPLMTKGSVQKYVDGWFEEHYNAKPRSNGLFAIGDYSVAFNYGKPHFVLPVGDYRYFWCKFGSEYVSDTFEVTSKITQKGNPGKTLEQITDEVMGDAGWSDKNLHEAISNGAEISLICEKAIMVPLSGDNTPAALLKQYTELIS